MEAAALSGFGDYFWGRRAVGLVGRCVRVGHVRGNSSAVGDVVAIVAGPLAYRFSVSGRGRSFAGGLGLASGHSMAGLDVRRYGLAERLGVVIAEVKAYSLPSKAKEIVFDVSPRSVPSRSSMNLT